MWVKVGSDYEDIDLILNQSCLNDASYVAKNGTDINEPIYTRLNIASTLLPSSRTADHATSHDHHNVGQKLEKLTNNVNEQVRSDLPALNTLSAHAQTLQSRKLVQNRPPLPPTPTHKRRGVLHSNSLNSGLKSVTSPPPSCGSTQRISGQSATNGARARHNSAKTASPQHHQRQQHCASTGSWHCANSVN